MSAIRRCFVFFVYFSVLNHSSHFVNVSRINNVIPYLFPFDFMFYVFMFYFMFLTFYFVNVPQKFFILVFLNGCVTGLNAKEMTKRQGQKFQRW